MSVGAAGGRADFAGQRVVDEEHPWLGLSSFSESVGDFFFGREAEVRGLTERVRQRPLTVLFGPSGLGKSSLLNAGVVPRLRQAGYLPLLVRVIYDRELQPKTPEQQIIEQWLQLSAAQRSLAERPPESLWELLHDPAYGLVQDESGSGEPLLRPVLILDQFEEVFTLGGLLHFPDGSIIGYGEYLSPGGEQTTLVTL